MLSTSFISSLSLWNTPRGNAAQLQAALAQANREIVDGRHADVGLALGSQVGKSFDLRRRTSEIDALQDGNGVAALRLSTSQAALKQMQTAADSTLQSILGLPAGQRGAAVAAAGASQRAALLATLNTSAGGQYVFGGTNTGTQPIKANAAADATAAVASAFQTTFGFPPGDAQAASITAAQMTAFLDGPVANLFTDANWKAGWSNASDTAIQSRIALGENVTTSVGAQAAPMRKLAMAYTIAADLGLTALSTEAQSAASDRITGLLGDASAGLVSIQADLGQTQARITDANTRMDAQKTLLSGEVKRLESVDPAEAKSRVDAITTQIQMSYALTAQLRQLNLVAYLS